MTHKIRALQARDPKESHRAATQLELLYDLVTVIAIAAVTETLHHGISGGHGLQTFVGFAAMFIALWWTWMNFTWFASAFDNGDALYVATVMVIMSGALIFAGGISSITATMNFSFGLLGWIIMRAGMIALWLRAAAANPDHRRTAIRFAIGIAVAQTLWTVLYFTVPAGHSAFLLFYVVIFAVELAVPVYAERARETPWHRHHIIERYGLLNIIVLGEVLVSIALMFGKLYEGKTDIALVVTAVSGLVIVFALWWLYFLERDHLGTSHLYRAFVWGYGHIIVFASGALIAAGLGAVMDAVTHHSHIDISTASAWANGAVAGYLFGLWFVRDRFLDIGNRRHVLLAAAAAVATLAIAGLPVWLAALALVAAALLRSRSRPAS